MAKAISNRTAHGKAEQNGRYTQMSQLTKTVYFADYPKSVTGRSGITVPFPEALNGAYGELEHLSSYSIRALIGYDSFAQLENDARLAQSSTATFLRDILVRNVRPATSEANRDYRTSLQSTFQGGKGSPLHDWYPYLEGYSPDFVNAIIDKYAPDARRILDPFCGSGTTALTSTLRGLKSLYAEVNPVCRFIIGAKFAALQLSDARRATLAKQLEALAQNINERLKAQNEDTGLSSSFRESFGSSEFFDKESFAKVLRLRTLADVLAKTDKLLGKFFLVAVLRSLVQGSLLVRRGDLRFRTAVELHKNPPRLLEELRASLHRIASDLHDAPFCEGEGEIVCNDARELAANINKPVDAIITSPPYLNGTNYFRNTKVELWFLRELSTREGLRTLRDAAITSGINDVTNRKSHGSHAVSPTSTLKDVLEKFSGNTYDQRIPLMVRAYFGEMSGVLENFYGALKPNGIAAIDLGDSCYGSVWVPTDKILSELMHTCGFEQIDRVVLRERQSRDGRKLGQTLQVFRKPEQTPKRRLVSKEIPFRLDSIPNWGAFKKTLPHQRGIMAKRNWGHSLHSLCSYQGKLKPSIAHSLVKALLPQGGGRLLDPFVGVGTIPFEAQQLGHVAYGFDISPAAVAISRAKLEHVDPAHVLKLMKKLEKHLASANLNNVDLQAIEAIRFNGPLQSYFHPRTLAEILRARSFFGKFPPTSGAGALVFSALLHILHGNRPYAVSRRSHPITPFAPTGPTEYRSVMERLRVKVEKSLVSIAKDELRRGRAFFQDATKPWPEEVDKLDAIITSPPFFDSTRFHTANWMRLWFAGWEADDFKSKPASFVDERQKQSFDVYRPIFKQSAERLKPGGFFLIHLGKSVKCDMAAGLAEVARAFLQHTDIFTENVEHCESHGIRDKGTVTHHQYVLMRRPG
jgi:tRNA G10  N-methylase Trm11